MEPIKIGIFGLGRGMTFAPSKENNTLQERLGYKLCAVCDCNKDKLELAKPKLGDDVQVFTDFDEMLKSDIDAVILANFFDEHAPFAIRALEAGKHVMSECTCNVTLAQGVALCRAVEKSGKIYMLAENYPFIQYNMELRRLVQSGELGTPLYAEGEYNHPMSAEVYNSISPGVYHWRNTMPATYYCTHAMGPLMVATDTMPKMVTALAVANDEVCRGTVKRSDPGAAMLCRMDNGAVFRLMGIAFPGGSGYYRIHGTRGAAETDRCGKLRVWHDEHMIPEGQCRERIYLPEWPEHGDLASIAGHGGGDFWTMYYFTKAIHEGKQPYLNVYRGVAMSSVGIQAWRSCLAEGTPMEIPDFTSEESRKKYENDHWNPLLKEGMDPSSIPPASIAGYEPNEDDFAYAKSVWEATGYIGLH